MPQRIQKLVYDEDGQPQWVQMVRRPEHYAGAHWPVLSDAIGVLPNDIPETRAEYAKRGVHVDFTADGRAVLTSPEHRRRVMRLTCGENGQRYRDRSGYD
jgi:hypothetical protein